MIKRSELLQNQADLRLLTGPFSENLLRMEGRPTRGFGDFSKAAQFFPINIAYQRTNQENPKDTSIAYNSTDIGYGIPNDEDHVE